MIEYLSRRIALSIKKADPQGNVSVDVMAYQLGYWLNPTAIVVLTLVIGWMTEAFIETIIGMLAFCVFRRDIGGFHFSSLTICFAVSTLLLSIIPHIVLNDVTVITLTIISGMLLIVFRREKGISLLLLISNIYLKSDVIVLAFFIHMIFVIVQQIGGEKGNETETCS
ncbi:accessory gene regulator B family protein [Paenibacillus sp. KS-LC4]|uniref:accessory gene regulator B family protein n=1 Tax=Paenibacillus sp. KS-LC4 TaxID=2979727 RepID=UPI0030CCF2BD